MNPALDPTTTDPTWALLSYAHPVLVGLGLLLALLALNQGLHLRKQRVRKAKGLRKLKGPKGGMRRHMQLARPGTYLLAAGFVLGPISSVWLRHWQPMSTVHGWAGLGAIVLFLGVGILGRLLRLKRSARGPLHGILGLLAAALAVFAAITGIELLA